MISETTALLIQVAIGIGLAASELTGFMRLTYSKFRTTQGMGISTRAGMVFVYALPVVVYVAIYLWAGAPRSAYHLGLLIAFVLHFAKRIVESLWVHRYSRPTSAAAFANIAFAYGALGGYAAYFQNVIPGRPIDALYL